jgi:hypothetical protein
MSYISANDYAEMKKFTLDELKKNIEEVKEAREGAILCSQDAQGERLLFILDSIKEYSAWIVAYENMIATRFAIATPPHKSVCIGSKKGQLNQTSHYAPEFQDILDDICN